MNLLVARGPLSALLHEPGRRVGDQPIPIGAGVLVDQRGTGALRPVRFINSRAQTPVDAAGVLPVCRRS
ncbi:hypothetical protein [Streptomyces virginiae]